jgi:hypothetical protein
LLPVQFATCRHSEEEICDILRRNYVGFMNNLHEVAEKAEYGLKVFQDTGPSGNRMNHGKASDTVFDMKTSVSVPQRRYVVEKLRQQREADALKLFSENFNLEINRHLATLQPIQKIMECRTAGQLLDTVFLVDKASGDQFVRIINELNQTNPHLYFLLTGPWPPYHFVGPVNMFK